MAVYGVNFNKGDAEFPFFKIAEFVSDIETVFEDEKTVTVEYTVPDGEGETGNGFVESQFDAHDGVNTWTKNGIVI